MLNEPYKKRPSVLVATPDLTFGIKLADWLAAHGYQAVLIRSWVTMIDECRDLRPQAVLIDLAHTDRRVAPLLRDALHAIETINREAVIVLLRASPNPSSAQVISETSLRLLEIQLADFAHIGRLLRAEIDHDATILSGPHAGRTSHEQWTRYGHARQGEGPSEMDHRTCHRCQGLMHPIDPLDPLDALRTGERDSMQTWRCISCGNLIDPIIIQNRHHATSRLARRRGASPRQPVFRETSP
ncbi:MAG: hypothetical protein NNA31_01680 [Nitrospira sp.]|nr:hypothetical protein [Nitrospira sp.]